MSQEAEDREVGRLLEQDFVSVAADRLQSPTRPYVLSISLANRPSCAHKRDSKPMFQLDFTAVIFVALL